MLKPQADYQFVLQPLLPKTAKINRPKNDITFTIPIGCRLRLALFFHTRLYILKHITMKKLSLLSGPVAGILLLVFSFSACKKNNDYVRTPAAGLMAFNLAPDKTAVGYSLSGNQLGNAALNYTNYTGAYLSVYLGNRELKSFDYNTGSTIATATGNFSDSMFYSVFLLGVNGSYRNVLVNDGLNSLTPAAGKAWIRYINAIPDSTSAVPKVTIGESSVNEPAPYATVSSFKQVNAGTVNTGITNLINITASRAITIEENKIYTVLFAGLPTRTDSVQAVQVKVIQNGSLTP
jgi:Domain of unknown function (DUF4397)